MNTEPKSSNKTCNYTTFCIIWVVGTSHAPDGPIKACVCVGFLWSDLGSLFLLNKWIFGIVYRGSASYFSLPGHVKVLFLAPSAVPPPNPNPNNCSLRFSSLPQQASRCNIRSNSNLHPSSSPPLHLQPLLPSAPIPHPSSRSPLKLSTLHHSCCPTLSPSTPPTLLPSTPLPPTPPPFGPAMSVTITATATLPHHNTRTDLRGSGMCLCV